MVTREDIERRIAIAKAARMGGDDWYSGDAGISTLRIGRARHIAANSPDAVIALCEELLAARKEISRLSDGLLDAHEAFVTRSPTEWAYQQACDVIEKKKTELLAAREEIAKLKHLVNQLPETSAKSVNSTSIGFPHD